MIIIAGMDKIIHSTPSNFDALYAQMNETNFHGFLAPEKLIGWS